MCGAVPTLIGDIHDGARRIERFIDDLKHFSRPHARGAGNRLNLNDAVGRALRLLSHLIKSRTDHLNVALAQQLPDIIGDQQHVEQIAVNLLTNAVEALPDENRCITVTTAFDAAARAVVLKVRDEGTGIPAEHLARLCDPFFTTKQDSGGTGLGLAITSSLVRLHGGRIEFDSEPGNGTCVQVMFPAVRDQQVRITASQAPV
jgi:polar amino acid transport system substrate-binding protein